MGDIRRIIREELKSLLESVAETADRADGYETGELTSAGLGAIKDVAERVSGELPHAWDCTIKTPMTWPKKCSCGVGDGE